MPGNSENATEVLAAKEDRDASDEPRATLLVRSNYNDDSIMGVAEEDQAIAARASGRTESPKAAEAAGAEAPFAKRPVAAMMMEDATKNAVARRKVACTTTRTTAEATAENEPDYNQWDSTVINTSKTRYEKCIYRCETERYEWNLVIEANLSTIHILEAIQTKLQQMSADEQRRFQLDDNLGGSSDVLQQQAIRRVYGDEATDIIESLKRNPIVAVPLVLRRLKAKDEEWCDIEKGLSKLWREQMQKYYLKSLDHQGVTFKKKDVKCLSSKSLMNEIKAIYDNRRKQMKDCTKDVLTGPHMSLAYLNPSIFEDAADLIIHHVKRQTCINKGDKHKIKQLLHRFIPDLFCLPRGDLSDDEAGKDDMEIDDGEGQLLPSTPNHWPDDTLPKNGDKGEIPTTSEDCTSSTSGSSRLAALQMQNFYSDDSYALFFVNDNWYLFFRLHHLLCERLTKVYRLSKNLAADEAKERKDQSESTAVALGLKPRSDVEVEDYYRVFLDIVKSMLDGNMSGKQYERSLREMFGIYAYTMFTLDKVVQNAVRQLQHMVFHEVCKRCTELFAEKQRAGGAGGRMCHRRKPYIPRVQLPEESRENLG
ncbi:hypothetical protein MTO96_034692 [Rhipicephalus appendiculatus]